MTTEELMQQIRIESQSVDHYLRVKDWASLRACAQEITRCASLLHLEARQDAAGEVGAELSAGPSRIAGLEPPARDCGTGEHLIRHGSR